jgi:hypothetical protein
MNCKNNIFSIITEMNKLVVSLSVIILGGVAYLVKDRGNEIRGTALSTLFISMATMLGAFSLFYSFESYRYLAEMLINKFLSPSELLDWYEQVQVYSLFFSLLFLGATVLTMKSRAK